MLERIRNFARLAVEVGVNVREGEDLIISSSLEDPTLAELIAEEAYKKGARLVSINWTDERLTRLSYQYQDQETLNEVPKYLVEKNRYQLEERRSNRISIYAEDPDLLAGLDPDKIGKAVAARSAALKEFSKYTINDMVSRLVIAYPTKKWARKVFPDFSEDEAVEKLWEVILDVSRVDESWEVTKKNWEDHIRTLDEKAAYLNEKQFDKVHYQSSNGTDLRVDLPKDHIRLSAGSKNEKGNLFVPNIPTEEVFTSPSKYGVNGKLVAVKPLVYNGAVIDDFSFTFEDGRVVDFSAGKGEETLRNLLETDEASRYLGEIALVPYQSPISLSGLLFYNTLFDENASCHFALGEAYPTTLKGGSDMDTDALEKAGLNDSLIHEDFMVGAKDLNIEGYKDGEKFDIFVDGNRA